MIDHAEQEPIKLWDYKEGRGDIKTYIWFEEQDYVIILQKREISYYGNLLDVYYVVTAYHIDGASQRRSFERKYHSREK